MEGSAHNLSLRPLPTEPKPNPPRPQPSKRTATNKRAKTSLPAPKASIPTKFDPTKPIEYEIVGMLSSRERYPEDLKTIRVTLSIPSPDDECPIALEPISTAKLACLQDISFIEGNPDCSKMTLPCGHSFSAMVIVYSWCKSNMLCPCCRRGLQCRANVNHLPAHFREQLRAQIAQSLSTERVEDERDSVQAMLDMTPMTTSFVHLADQGCLEMTVGFYFRRADEEPVTNSSLFSPANQRETSSRGHFSMLVRLTTLLERRNGGPLVAVFRPSDRNMTVLRQSTSDVRAVNITTQMRILGVGVIEIDSSGEIDIPAPLPAAGSDLSRTPLIVRRATGYRPTAQQGQPNTLPIVPVSTFELSFGQRGNYVYLDSVTWVPDSTHVYVSLHTAAGEE